MLSVSLKLVPSWRRRQHFSPYGTTNTTEKLNTGRPENNVCDTGRDPNTAMQNTGTTAQHNAMTSLHLLTAKLQGATSTPVTLSVEECQALVRSLVERIHLFL